MNGGINMESQGWLGDYRGSYQWCDLILDLPGDKDIFLILDCCPYYMPSRWTRRMSALIMDPQEFELDA